MSDYVPATVANMRKYGGRGMCLLDLSNGETFSATPGDYFLFADDEVITNDGGEALVIAVDVQAHAEPLKAAI